jgi:hypothetical protein
MNRLVSWLGGRSMAMILIAIVAPSLTILAAFQSAGASSPPAVTVSPQGNYHDGQTISVQVGPNSYFTPHARIIIIECADPGGLPANLPRDITTCDGNTVQGGTILVGGDGSFSLSAYPLYLLPSAALAEQPGYKPVCNQTNYCVLYIGQDQNDFTKPKVFSAPYLIAPSAATSGTGAGASSSSGGSGTSSGSSGTGSTGAAAKSSTGANPGVSLATSATLANTGPPVGVEWVLLCGMVLLVGGVVGRRLLLRGGR